MSVSITGYSSATNVPSKGTAYSFTTNNTISATGGTTADITLNGVAYRTHTFTTVGNTTFTISSVPTSASFNYLVVAGGGGGGVGRGGGGGGGGVLTGTMSLSATSYTITVGAGGANAYNDLQGGDGGSSSIAALVVATGGGGGGGWTTNAGRAGGSGGGASAGSTASGGTGVAGQGFAGSVRLSVEVGGGGGGAGASTAGRDGAIGVSSMITGTTTYYGGGGGAGSSNAGTPGVAYGGTYQVANGIYGGGNGANTPGTNQPYQNALANTGGGGGGQEGYTGNSGSGGSGIVIISYLINGCSIIVPAKSYILIESFENIAVTSYTYFSTGGWNGWSWSQGGISYGTTPFVPDPYSQVPESNHYSAFVQTTASYNPSILSHATTIASGATVNVSFWWCIRGALPPTSFTFSYGSTVVWSISNPSTNNTWTYVSFSFIATSANQNISFATNLNTSIFQDQTVSVVYVNIVSKSSIPSASCTVDYLLVGGGGGAGGYIGGGGGGGYYSYRTKVQLTAGIYTLTVGEGGTGQIGTGTAATNGGATIMYLGGTTYDSGPGGGGQTSFGQGGTSGPFIGGLYNSGTINAGGGAGSAANGVDGATNSGNGGNGVQINITGTATYYGGGGGGGQYTGAAGSGGLGGGANGAPTYNPVLRYDGTNGLGGGGGGSSGGGASLGGYGGSGIAIIMIYSTKNIIGLSQSLSGFDPRSIPGCLVWLDSSDQSTITYSGANITSWSDKTINRYLFTPFLSSFPTWTSSGIYFGSEAGIRNTVVPFGTSYSIFAVANLLTTPSGWAYIAHMNTSGDLYGFFGSSDGTRRFATFNGNTGPVSGWNDVSVNTPLCDVALSPQQSLLSMDVSGAVLQPYFNGNAMTAKTGTTGATTGLNLGVTYISSQAWTGHIAEFIVFSSQITDAQRQNVEGYLAWKWNIGTQTTDRISFSPTSVGTCKYWFDAADTGTITSSSGTVSSWTNKGTVGGSASSYTGTVTTGTTGQNSLNTLVFPTSASLSHNFNISGQPRAYFWAAKITSFNTSGIYSSYTPHRGNVAGGSGEEDIQFWSTDSGTTYAMIMVAQGITGNIGATVPYLTNVTNVFNVYTISNQSTTAANRAAINGVSLTLNTDNNTANSYQTGSVTGTIAYNSNSSGSMELGEMLIYDGAVTIAQAIQIENYLMAKWGVKNVLPRIHPFYPGQPFTRYFNPNDIDSCILWLDGADAGAASMTLSGTTVTTWYDKSGNGNNTTSYTGTPTITAAAINGIRAVYFNGSSYLQGAMTGSGTTQTIFVVGIESSGAAGNAGLVCAGKSGILDWNDVSSFAITNGGGASNPIVLATRTVNSQLLPVTYTTPFLISITFDGTYVNSTFNGAVEGTAIAVSGTFSYTNYSIGTRAGSTGPGAANWLGYIGEVIIYQNNLSITERQRVEGYLGWKWGINTALPGTLPNLLPGITGLQLWLDAADPNNTGVTPSNGTAVGLWYDKSGNGNNAGRNGPSLLVNTTGLNSKPAVAYTGSTFYTGNISITGTTVTCFVVGSFVNSGGGDQRFISLAATSQLDYDAAARVVGINNQGSSPDLSTYRSYTMVGRHTHSYSTPFIACSVYDGTNGYLFVNGVPGSQTASSASTGTFSISKYAIGDQVSPTGEIIRNGGFVSEVLIYNTALTTFQRKEVEAYLSRKWSIAVTTAVHPYYAFPPSSAVPFIPLSVSNCYVWLDAADVSSIRTSGSTVIQWQNKGLAGGSAVKNTGTCTSGISKYNNLNMVNCPSGNDLSITATFPNQARAWFFVIRNNTQMTSGTFPNTYWGLIAATAYSADSIYFSLVSGSYYTEESQNSIGAPLQSQTMANPFNLMQLYTYQNSAASPSTLNTINVNGVPQTLSTSTVATSYLTTSSAYVISTAGYAKSADICEILMYNGELTIKERQKIEGYLANKWGI